MSLEILFEDAHCLVVNKPAGLSTQAPPIAGMTLQTLVRNHLSPDDPEKVFVGTVHRLDRPVSGVVLWAKTSRDARRLARQFESRRVKKQYWAAVAGRPEGQGGLWEDWLCREETGLGRVQVCAPGTPRSQHALTRWQVLNSSRLPAQSTLIELKPETGRMHQLRVQLAARRLPILGDEQYGSNQRFPSGIALHARSLTFFHPVLGTPISLVAPLPASWAEAGIISADPLDQPTK